MATAILKLASAATMIIIAVCLAAAVSVWSSQQLDAKGLGDWRSQDNDLPILADVWFMGDGALHRARSNAGVVVAVAQVDPWTPLTLDNVLPVELDMTSGKLRLSNGQPVSDPERITWIKNGRQVWEQLWQERS